MKFISSRRFLMIYSGVLTLVFAGTVLMGATSTTRNASFDQVTVHRINVVEPDGTMRMTISDAAEAPGSYFHNRDYPRPDRRVAGIVFMNDEGTENGGLIFGGSKGKGDKVSSFGHLSFDNYDQNQTLVLQNSQDETDRKATYIQINDRPDWPIHELAQTMRREGAMTDPAKRKALLGKFFRTHPRGSHRAFLGTRGDRSSELVLRDPRGHPRIVARVAADGKPVLQFLDADGKVIEQFPQAVKR